MGWYPKRGMRDPYDQVTYYYSLSVRNYNLKAKTARDDARLKHSFVFTLQTGALLAVHNRVFTLAFWGVHRAS